MQASPLELGHLISAELNLFKRNHQGLYASREYSLSWHHSRLRNDYHAFYLLCFYLELITKMAAEDELAQRDFGSDHCGLFRVLSNAIYHLENSWSAACSTKHLALFLAKLIIELGITPNLQRCLYSNQELSRLQDFQLVFDQGGFVEASYLTEPGANHRKVWEILDQSWKLPYAEVAQLTEVAATHIEVLYHYLLFQTQIPQAKLKAASLGRGGIFQNL